MLATVLTVIGGGPLLAVFQVTVCGHVVEPNNSTLFRQMGLSPQEDPLWPVITMKEHLECYAELRGIPQPNVDTVVRR